MYIHIFINSIICKYAIQPLGCKVLVINYPSIYPLSRVQRKWCLIAWGWWISLRGYWFLFLTCPMGKQSSLREFKLQKNCNQCSSKNFFGLVEMTFGLVKLTFFAPCLSNQPFLEQQFSVTCTFFGFLGSINILSQCHIQSPGEHHLWSTIGNKISWDTFFTLKCLSNSLPT